MRLLAFCLLMLTSTQFSALGAELPAGFRLVKTDGGCQVAISPQEFDDFTKGGKQTRYSWSGMCRGGLANGLGEFRKEERIGLRENPFSMTTVKRQRFHQGLGFGYGLVSREVKMSPTPRFVKFGVFDMQGEELSLSGAFLVDMPNLLDLPIGTLPNINLDTLQVSTSIASPAGMLIFSKGPCSFFQAQLPDCRSENGSTFDVLFVSMVPRLPDGRVDFGHSTRTLCPSREVYGCIPMVKALATPILQAGFDLVRSSADEERRLRTAMDQTDNELAKSKLEQDERNARLAVEARARAAKEEAEFQSKLRTAAVGQLYALGDEFQAKGDKPRARAAYRALLSRFPDHALAQIAAKALIDLR
jgi:hypothetical protein